MVVALGAAFGLFCISGPDCECRVANKKRIIRKAERLDFGVSRIRFADLERTVARLELTVSDSTKTTQAPPPVARGWVTQADLHTALAEIRATVRQDTEVRLEASEQTMESLRALIVETDSMLEQVLEKLEAAG